MPAEDRTELLFGRDELSDATVLLTKLERLGLPAVANTMGSSDGPEGLDVPPRAAQANGSWFTPVLGEALSAPADPFTDTTVIPSSTASSTALNTAPATSLTTAPSGPPAPSLDSAPSTSRPGLGNNRNDGADTAIIQRADGDDPYPDRDSTPADDHGTTRGEHADIHHDDIRHVDTQHVGYGDDDHDTSAADDVENDDDSLPQLTSFGVRTTSNPLTTPQSTDKTAESAGPSDSREPDPADSVDKVVSTQGTDAADGAGDRDPAAAARDAIAARTAKIDETLSRLTAIHAGLGDEVAERVSRSDRDRARTAKKSPRSGPDKTDATKTGTTGKQGTGKQGKPGKAADAPDKPGRSRGTTTGKRSPLSRLLRNRSSRVTAIVLVAVLVLTPAIGFGGSWWLNGKLRPVAALDGTGAGVVDAAGQAGDQNYLVVVAGEDDLPQTVVLAHLPAQADRAVLLSTPANLVVNRPGCERYDSTNRRYSGDTVPAESDEPLANAFEEGGPRCLVTTLQRMTGVPINHYIQLDPAGITPMVDAVNGVPMCVSDRVEDAVLGPVVPTAGQQVMNGDQAKAYATAREVRGEPTDGSGMRMRQQRVLSALLTKASALSPFLHLPTVASLASALGSNSYVDKTDLGELASLGDALTAINQTKVDYVRVPTAAEADTQGNTILDSDEATKLFSALRGNRPLDGEGDSSSSTDGESSGLPPNAVTLSVLNGSSHAGVAGKAADSLRGVGFTVASVRDSRHQDGGASVIRASADQSAGSTTLARAVPGAIVQTVPGTGILELVLGDSFDGQVQAAPGSTTAGPSLVTAAQLACR